MQQVGAHAPSHTSRICTQLSFTAERISLQLACIHQEPAAWQQEKETCPISSRSESWNVAVRESATSEVSSESMAPRIANVSASHAIWGRADRGNNGSWGVKLPSGIGPSTGTSVQAINFSFHLSSRRRCMSAYRQFFGSQYQQSLHADTLHV